MAGRVMKQLAGSGTGQSFTDIMTSVKYTLSRSDVIKTIYKATTEEIMAPKRKHLQYLVQCTFEPHLSITDFANNIINRTQHSNFVVALKAMMTIHHLMQHGSDRFFQYIASCNYQFGGYRLCERNSFQAHRVVGFLQPYGRYLDEKAAAYREVAFDFCRLERGKFDGEMRTMAQDKLLKAIPMIENMLDSLLQFEIVPTEYSNSLLRLAHLFLYRDLMKLYGVYNESMINLIGRFFLMSKRDCRISLDIYKRFVKSADKVNAFIKVAESTDYLATSSNVNSFQSVPSSVLEALEQHVNYLESHNKRVLEKSSNSPNNATSTSTTRQSQQQQQQQQQQTSGHDYNHSTSDLYNFTQSTDFTLTESERNKIIEEERCRLEAFVSAARKHAASGNERDLITVNDDNDDDDDDGAGGGGCGAAAAGDDHDNHQMNNLLHDLKSTTFTTGKSIVDYSHTGTYSNTAAAAAVNTQSVDNLWSHSNSRTKSIDSSLFDFDKSFSRNTVIPFQSANQLTSDIFSELATNRHSSNVTPSLNNLQLCSPPPPSSSSSPFTCMKLPEQTISNNTRNPFLSPNPSSSSSSALPIRNDETVIANMSSSHPALPTTSNQPQTQQSKATVNLDDKIAQLAGDLSFQPANPLMFRAPDGTLTSINWSGTMPLSNRHQLEQQQQQLQRKSSFQSVMNASSIPGTTGPVYRSTQLTDLQTPQLRSICSGNHHHHHNNHNTSNTNIIPYTNYQLQHNSIVPFNTSPNHQLIMPCNNNHMNAPISADTMNNYSSSVMMTMPTATTMMMMTMPTMANRSHSTNPFL